MSVVAEHIRQQVRQRTGGRCEYCHLPDNQGVYPFHVEHIIARKHGGASTLDNLAWACFSCNVAKGSDLATPDPLSGELTALFNPRLQTWNDHFEILDGEIRGIMAAGRATVRLLRFNSEKQVVLRRQLIEKGMW
jgi:hypothetical protein